MTEDRKAFYSRMTLAWIVTGVTFMELLDTSILNTAIPVLGKALGTNVFEVKAAVTAYLAALAVFIPASGWLADSIGTKTTMMSAIALFTASSLACGFSSSVGQLVFFRVLQGIGGAMMTPVSRLILVRLFKGEELARAAGLVAIPIVFGPILGPLLGGYITTKFHWSWIFFINVPIGILALTLIGLNLKNERAARRPPFDLKGFLLAGFGLAALTFALENADNPLFSKWLTLLLLLGGAALAAVTVRHCRRTTGGVFDMTLFRLRTFRGGLLMLLVGVVAAGGLQLLLPVEFQLGFGMTPLQSGLLTFYVALGSVAAKPFIVPVCGKLGYRRVLTLFPVAMAATVFSFCLFRPGYPGWLIGTQLFLYGLCFSFLGNMINVIPYTEVDRERTGKAISLQSTLFQFSLSFGVSLSSLLLGMFLKFSGAEPGGPAGAGALPAFRWCFAALGTLCLLLALVNTRFRNNDFTLLAGKTPPPAGD